MEIRQLEYFLQVAGHGSVTKAAEHLHVAQPSLSQSLRRLERELASPLFVRVGRGMRLTAAGEALVGPARRILREREFAHAAVADVRGLRGGRLSIASLPSLAVDPLARLVGEFRSLYPEVTIHIAESLQPDEIGGRVESGECEIGLAPELKPSDHLEAHEIATQPLALVAPRSMSTLSDPLTPAQLSELPFVTGPAGGSSRIALEAFMQRAGVRLTIAVQTDSTEAILPLVQAGAGVALLPRGLAFSGATKTRVLSTDPPAARRTFVLHRREMTSPAAVAFLALAQASKV